MAARAGRVALRGCLLVAGTAAAVVFALVVALIVATRPEEPPDVAKAARAAGTRAAGRDAAASVDAQVDRLRAAMPWAGFLGTTRADYCETSAESHGWGAGQTWSPVRCIRTVTLYAALDGDFRQRLDLVDTALATADWHPRDGAGPSAPGRPPGLGATLDRVLAPPADPSPEELAAAAARPRAVRLEYDLPAVRNPAAPGPAVGPAHPPTGRVEVTASPRLPTLDDGRSAYELTLRYPSVRTRHFVQWEPYDPAALAAAAAAHPAHGAVLAASLTVTYGAGS